MSAAYSSENYSPEVLPLCLGDAAEILQALRELRDVYRPRLILVMVPKPGATAGIDARVEAIDAAVMAVCQMVRREADVMSAGGAK